MSDDFTAARLIAGLVALVGWVFLALGLIGAVFLFSDDEIPAAGAVFFAGVGFGLSAILGGHLARAMIVTAENTGQIAQAMMQSARPAEPVRAPGRPPVDDDRDQDRKLIETYKGFALRDAGGGQVFMGGRLFANLAAARVEVDRISS